MLLGTLQNYIYMAKSIYGGIESPLWLEAQKAPLFMNNCLIGKPT